MASANATFIYNTGASSIGQYRQTFGASPIVIWVINKIHQAITPEMVFSQSDSNEAAIIFNEQYSSIGNYEAWYTALSKMPLYDVPEPEPEPEPEPKSGKVWLYAGALLVFLLLMKK